MERARFYKDKPIYRVANWGIEPAARKIAQDLTETYLNCVPTELEKLLREKIKVSSWVPTFYRTVDEEEHHQMDQLFSAHHEDEATAFQVKPFSNLYFTPWGDSTLKDILDSKNIWQALVESSLVLKLEGERQEFEVALRGRLACPELEEVLGGDEGAGEEEHHQHSVCAKKKAILYLSLGTSPVNTNGLYGNIEFNPVGIKDVEAKLGYRLNF